MSLESAFDIQSGLTLITGGNANWFEQTETTHDTIDAIRSGVIGHGQSTWIQTVVQGPCSISFWWKVYSEGGYDFLSVYVNDNLYYRISGNIDWTQIYIGLINEEEYTIKWVYSKDGSISVGSDCGFLDQFTYYEFDINTVLGTTGLSFLSGGNYQWVIDNSIFYNGTTSLRSGLIGHGQTSWIDVSLTTPQEGYLNFYLKISSETNFDTCSVVYGMTEKIRISGNIDWTLYQIHVYAGETTIRFTYSKDGSSSAAYDCVWLDNLSFIPLDESFFHVSKAIGYAVIKTPNAFNVSKIVGFTVLKIPSALNLSKLLGYAVVKPYLNEGFGHLDPELGSNENNGSSWHNAWRTIAGGPTSSRITSGNCLVKIAKSEDPISIGQAQWIGTKSDTTYKNDEYTNILIRFNEAHNSTSAKETSQNYLDISSNNLLITNAQSKLNSTSGYFNGSSTYVSIPDTELLNFGTEDWTIDFWFCPTGSCSGLYPEIMSTQSGWNNGAIKITWDETDRRLGISCYYSGSGRGWITSYNLNFNQWYHAAYVRIGAYIYVYIDGILTITCSIDASIGFDWCYGGSCRIGGGNWDGSNSYYLGYLSELRVSKYARWTSNFTPPTQPYDVLHISRVILPVALNKLIDDCETAWTASTNITCSVSTTKRIQYYSSLISISANFTTGKVAYKQLSQQLDLSSFQKISLFFHSTANITINTLKICLCSDTSGDIIVNNFIIPTVYDMSSSYYPLALTLDAGVSLGNNINSIALYAISDPGTIDIKLDHIIACNSLSLNSVISKNTSNEPWCIVQSIFDNIVYISSYFGEDEIVETYIRDTFNIEQSTSNYLQVSGSNGGVIKYKAGYNKSTDQVDGETFYLGRLNTIGLHTNSKNNIYLDKINIMGANTGLYIYNSNNLDININNINNYRLPASNSFYMSGSYNNKINIKNLFYQSPRISVSNSDNNTIDIINHNLPITHSGYNNKLYNTNNLENILINKNYFSNSKIFTNDLDANLTISNNFSSSTDNSVIYQTRLYKEDNQNIITKYKGITLSQTNIRHTQSGLAWKLYLSQTVNKLAPLKLSILKLAVEEYKIITVSCYFYRDSPLITGALVCERWQLNGIDSDAIAYTTPNSLNAWEQLTINFSPTQTGVVDIKAYAYGDATYSVYVDDISYSQVS